MRITLICADDDHWALGLRSISSVLIEAGHRTRIILTSSLRDPLTGRAAEGLREACRDSGLIGISSMSRGSARAKSLIRALRPLDRPIVWGGMHPTLFPEDCVGHADLICRGEGEAFMADLAGRLTDGRGYLDIPGGGYLREGRTVLNDVGPTPSDLEALPFPDFTFSDEHVVGAEGSVRPNAGMRDAASVLFSGSRGCAFNCHYCSNARLKSLYDGKGRYVRKMSVPKFIASVKRCQEIFPRAKYVYFTDEDFFARPLAEFREFAETYPKEVGLPFECMASPQQISEEKMALLVRAGLWRVDVGVESGSDRVKKEIFNRLGTNDVVMKAAAAVNRHPQVVAYYFFIIGNPYEEREDLLGTVGLIRRLPPPAFVRTYNLVFLPGTHLYERALRDGIIRGLEDSGFDLDFLAGFDHRRHAWKARHLYLNALLSLMTGKSTRRRIGFVPRFALPFLTDGRWLDLNERRPGLSKIMVALARAGLVGRRKAMLFVSRLMRDPSSAYRASSLVKKAVTKT